MKKLFALILIVAVSILSGCGCADKTIAEDEIKVSVEIVCTEILENYDDLDSSLRDEKYVPSDGIILSKTDVVVNEGDDAVDVLKQIAKENNIQIDVSGGYAKSINYIYEKSCGEMSGWVYEVNNEMIMDEYTVTEGDLVTWKFICSFE